MIGKRIRRDGVVKYWRRWLKKDPNGGGKLEEFGIDLSKSCNSFKSWKRYVRKRIRDSVVESWKREVKISKNLEWLKNKEKPKWEYYLNGTDLSKALFKLRTGDWDYGEKRKKWEGEGKELCRLCGQSVENTYHIVMECNEIEIPAEFRKERYLNRKGVERVLGIRRRVKDSCWKMRRVIAGRILKKLKKVKVREGS